MITASLLGLATFGLLCVTIVWVDAYAARRCER